MRLKYDCLFTRPANFNFSNMENSRSNKGLGLFMLSSMMSHFFPDPLERSFKLGVIACLSESVIFIRYSSGNTRTVYVGYNIRLTCCDAFKLRFTPDFMDGAT